MSFFASLKRIFSGTSLNDQSDDTAGDAASAGGGSSDENGVAMISCEEVSARLFEYLDGELEGMSEEEVRLHLEACEACYPRVQFEKHFLKALRRTKGGGRVSDSLRERVLQSLAEDEGQD